MATRAAVMCQLVLLHCIVTCAGQLGTSWGADYENGACAWDSFDDRLRCASPPLVFHPLSLSVSDCTLLLRLPWRTVAAPWTPSVAQIMPAM